MLFPLTEFCVQLTLRIQAVATLTSWRRLWWLCSPTRTEMSDSLPAWTQTKAWWTRLLWSSLIFPNPVTLPACLTCLSDWCTVSATFNTSTRPDSQPLACRGRPDASESHNPCSNCNIKLLCMLRQQTSLVGQHEAHTVKTSKLFFFFFFEFLENELDSGGCLC